ncbi:MAG: sulfate adenylyltransferase [Planctomycetes bacterium]|nr:sulfate adenylyltransferase [Planctomycetota bacterium]
MSIPQSPVGGRLVDRVLNPQQAAALQLSADSLYSIRLAPSDVWDLKLLAVGGYSPLTGFQGEADYLSVIRRGRLADGTPWTVPVTLGVDEAQARELTPGALVALRDQERNLLGSLTVREVFARRLDDEARGVFQTLEDAHPGVARIRRAGQWLVAGEVSVLPALLPSHEQGLIYRPAEVRAEIARRGWRTVVAFQTRNPIHRAHEYLLRTALETADGLLVHPLVGETKGDDVPAEVRVRCYRALLEKHFPPERIILAALPAPMRYAGPKEAIHHALIRRNYGASHFIVGRDHAGVGNYYGTYDAQRIFETYAPGELGIATLNFEHSFWCKGVGGFATTKTSPFGPEHRIQVSGTRLRELLAKGEFPPPEIVRPELAAILMEHYQSVREQAPVA